MTLPVYLDNAATTFPKPPSVLNAVINCIKNYCGNPGRSSHEIAIKAAEGIFDVRQKISEFINFPYVERIVFTQNATHALNMAILGLIDNGSHVITSDIEHNSVIRPLCSLESKGLIEVSVFDSDIPIDAAIEPLIRENSKYLVISLASNVTGKAYDLYEIYRASRRYNLITIVDASQYIGHFNIDWKLTPFDVICAPGHKSLFGIPGSGFAAFNMNSTPNPIIHGGTGSNSLNYLMPEFLPDRLEAGTLNLPSILSLGAGIDYLNAFGTEFVAKKLKELTDRLYSIADSLGLIIYGCENGILSFTHKTKSVEEVANHLIENDICIRSGFHCAPMIHRKLGTENEGTVRVSLSIMNNQDDIDYLYSVLKSL